MTVLKQEASALVSVLPISIIAIGASAGGLEACRHLLAASPRLTDFACILVQHLDPNHESLLVELLAGKTALVVSQAQDGTLVEPAHLYVIPPGCSLAVIGGRLVLSAPIEKHGARLPFDFLLHSLATAQQAAKSVAVILSGTGSDGTQGALALRAAGGFVIAQDPEEAGFDGMPRAAMAAGAVDLVLPVAAMPAALLKRAAAPGSTRHPADDHHLAQILALLRQSSGTDFTHYKPGTVRRRMERRMGITGQAGLQAYRRLLEGNAEEAAQLAKDLLIHVTSFFRDDDVFDLLARKTIPDLLAAHPATQPLRVWAAGCSTGEEVWSLAMLFREAIAAGEHDIRLQIFASDKDTGAVATARQGRYPASIANAVSAARLARFFTRDDDSWQVGAELRALVVFTVQDLLADPPFSRLDFVSCRNLLIYLKPQAQARVIALFHFALRPGGVMLLGQSEGLGAGETGFTALAKPERIWRRNGTAVSPAPVSRAVAPAPRLAAPSEAVPQVSPPREAAPRRKAGSRIATLERELQTTRDELRGAIQDLERAAEEQRVVNEEALSTNEEFQSTNEELTTSKEELQSLNEELTVLNGQLQETLEHSRTTSNDLQNVLYSTREATLFLDRQLRIRFFTPATLAVFSVLAGDIGRPLADLRSLAEDSSLLEDAAAVLRGAEPRVVEITTAAGAWFSRRVLPYRAQNQTVEGVVITFVDITARREATTALADAALRTEQASAAKSRFLGAASHDLRQPLQTLTLLCDLLEKIVSDEEARKLVALQRPTIAAMSGMLNALLDINQIDTGTLKAAPVALRVGGLLAALREEFGYLATVQGLELRVVPCGLTIRSDPRLLEQILRNLLSNALKYTSQGRILLGCRRRAGMLSIEVWDTGIGIPEKHHLSIFDEYSQIGNEARERSRGMGLGLSIVRRLAALLEHRVTIRSKPGSGSMFAIETPLGEAPLGKAPLGEAPPAVMTPGPESTTPGPADPQRTGSILVVEDDPDVRALLVRVLAREGHIVQAAADGQAALDLVAQDAGRPALILADFNLPNGMDGLRLAALLRERLGGVLPVVILTADISTSTLSGIAQANCLRLHKPIGAAELIALVQRLLAEAASAAAPAPPPLAKRAAVRPGVTTLHVVDDDAQLRAVLVRTLGRDGQVVQGHASAEDFLGIHHAGDDACLLVDVQLPGMSGFDLLDHLRKAGDLLPAIMITGFGDVAAAVQAMRSGASDFIEKPVRAATLRNAIDRAMEHARDGAKQATWRAVAAASLATLTARQREVMDRVLAGDPSKTIAFDMGISQRTVETHRAEIMRRTGTKSLPALARLALAASADKELQGASA